MVTAFLAAFSMASEPTAPFFLESTARRLRMLPNASVKASCCKQKTSFREYIINQGCYMIGYLGYSMFRFVLFCLLGAPHSFSKLGSTELIFSFEN